MALAQKASSSPRAGSPAATVRGVRPLLSAAVLRSQSDERLVALARAGHEQAFAAISNRYRRELHAHARRIGPADRSEDVVQQAMLSAWTALGRQTDVQELRPWLHRIVHNAAIRGAARTDEHDELHHALAGPGFTDTAVEQRSEAREALVAVAALPERQRRAFEMTALRGASGSDAAVALGVSEGTLRQLVHRARTALRSGSAAFIPGPLVSWAAASGSGDTVAGRVAELSAGAGLAASVGKVCTAVAVTASIVGGTTQILHDVGSHHLPRDRVAAARGVRHEAHAVAISGAPTASAVALASSIGSGSNQARTASAHASGPIAAQRSLPAPSPGPRRWSKPAGNSPGSSGRSGASGRGDGRPRGGDNSTSGGSTSGGGGSSNGGGSSPNSGPAGGTSSSQSDHAAASTLASGPTTGETASADESRPAAPAATAPATPGTTTANPTPQPGQG